MPLTKHPFGRYQIIDRELVRRDWVKTKELQAIIEDDLGILISEKMINNDIIAMRDDSLLGYFAPIEYNTSEKAYFYTDSNYTIKAFGLNDGDINALKFYANTLNQYKEYEVFRDFSGAIEKVLDAVRIRSGISELEQAQSVVQTEQTPSLAGSALIPIIVQALNEKRAIEFQYLKFSETEPKTVNLQPYLLKEDRHRWYIVGKTEKYKDPTTTYALDRMVEVTVLEDKFEPITFDFDKYFENSLGITVTESEPIDVVLSFTAFQGKYLKTLKIHPSQLTLVDKDAEFRISINIKPSWELYEKLLGYGKTVRVLSPPEVVSQMKEIIKELSSFYLR